MSFLAQFLSWFRRGRARPDLHFVLYTRAGCHLCDDAWQLLARQQSRYGFRLETRDVDAAPELCRAHGDWVPVVTVNGQVRFRGRVNEVLLRRLLEARDGAR
jgi:glutaredoxin